MSQAGRGNRQVRLAKDRRIQTEVLQLLCGRSAVGISQHPLDLLGNPFAADPAQVARCGADGLGGLLFDREGELGGEPHGP